MGHRCQPSLPSTYDLRFESAGPLYEIAAGFYDYVTCAYTHTYVSRQTDEEMERR